MACKPMRIVWMAAALASLPALCAAQQPSPRPGAEHAVALVGDVPVTPADLDAFAKDRLTRLRNEEYTIRRQALDDLVGRMLLEKEAARRGITVAALMQTEIEAKAAPVTEDQKRAVFESAPSRFGGMNENQALAQIEANLKQGRLADARRRFVGDLRKRAGVTILLSAPRAAVDAARGPSKGSAAAPITIVEFSDFQCPYCRKGADTLKRIEERYGDKVRIVFRDFPLPMHKDAPKAAEAAACANAQNQFWAMHDKLFAAQSNLQVPDLKRVARDLGLNAAEFDQCLDSGRFESQWQQNRAEGQKFGVSATPTFFINGRMVTGALPYEAFTDIMEEELAHTASNSMDASPKRR
jgi:protein-disulfide isomerase